MARKPYNENISINELKFDSNGLIPAVVVDSITKNVLTVAYMNKESLQISVEKGLTCFFSRSRQKLWLKGETSGNVQHIVSITADCVLDVSHLGIISACIDRLSPDVDTRAAILKCVGEKNTHEITAICRNAGLDDGNSRRHAEVEAVSLDSLLEYPCVTVTAAQAQRFSNGGALDRNRIHSPLSDGICKVYSPENKFLGLAD